MNKNRDRSLRGLLLVISILFAVTAWVSPVSADEGSPFTKGAPLSKAAYVPDQIVVKFKDGLGAEHVARLHAGQGTTVVAEASQIGVQVLSVPTGQVEAKLAAYRADPGVEYAEPDYIALPAYEPNDPSFSNGTQWALQKIYATQAWNLSQGDPNVVIAILDWGVDLDHPDLASDVWTNADEIPDNGTDDDGNGYIDDVHGWDFANWDNDPQDDYHHGTHVAGIAAAATDNGVGVAGVGFNSRIMAVKVGYNHPVYGVGAPYDAIASGIVYAADNGARVINLSLGGYSYSPTLRDAVNYAWNAGCVVVGAAGNNNLSDPFYPAAFDNVMGVSSSDQNDVRASFSNYGSYISVAAPGVNIYSTCWYNDDPAYLYFTLSGTSMAAPHVAGLAALLFSQDGGRSNTTVRSLIEDSADDLGTAGWDQYYGYGRINAFRALGIASTVVAPESGGSLSADNGDLTLDFPPGSVTKSTTVTYVPNPSPSNPTGDLVFANMACDLEATDGEGTPVTQFDPPYTLTLHYQDADWQDAEIEDESQLNLYYWDGSQWEALLPCSGCSLDTTNNELVAVLGHFSEFGLMGGDAEPTRVSLASFAARSGETAPATAGIAPWGWLALIGTTLLAVGAHHTSSRLRKR